MFLRLPPLGRITALLGMLAAFPTALLSAEDSRRPLTLIRSWTMADGLPDNRIKAVRRTADGRLWLGTRAGLVCFNQDRLEVFNRTTTPKLPGNEFWGLAEAVDGTLWALSSTGLASWNRDEFASVRYALLPNTTVTAIVTDSPSGLWIGTLDGLGRRVEGEWSRFTDESGLFTKEVQALGCDQRGRVWIGAPGRLQRYDPETGRVEQFASPGGEPEVRYYAVYVQTEDTLWFTVRRPSDSYQLWRWSNGHWDRIDDGFAVVDGRLLVAARDQAGQFWRLSDRLPIQDWIDPDTRRLVVPKPAHREFIWSLDEDPEGNLWVGTESSGLQLWRAETSPTSAASAPFAQVGVRAAESGQGDLPAQTAPWLSGAIGVSLASSLALLVWRQRRRIGRLRVERETALAAERQRMAQDIHDLVGPHLTQLAMLSAPSNPFASTPAVEPSSPTKITQSVQEMSRALRDAIWVAHPADPSVDGFFTHLAERAQELIQSAGLNCRLALPWEVPDVELDPLVRRHLLFAAREAIHNAVRHAGATTVTLSGQMMEDRLELRIADDGMGFSECAPGRGLAGMRRRLEELCGVFECQSAPGGGTQIRLLAPLSLTDSPPRKSVGDEVSRL